MAQQHTPAPVRPTANPRTWWAAYRAAWLNPDGSSKRTPAWALGVLLVTSGLLVPLFLLINSEDLAYSASTSGTQGPGGETKSRYNNGITTNVCRDAPVEYAIDGRPYAGTDVVSGECLAGDESRAVTVRYDPDDPDDFTTTGRQWVLYGFAGLAALGFVVTLVAVIRRLRARQRERAEGQSGAEPPHAPGGTGS